VRKKGEERKEKKKKRGRIEKVRVTNLELKMDR
jgi:hypothetical protein